jgi:hypothetical protein
MSKERHVGASVENMCDIIVHVNISCIHASK